ncbi:hypothetical protein JYU34_019775 [Plutella xylostella]|uniref:FP protein C-terminal domain-containing protein n=1 Tax=Plutella xylostella TaxID=51655 RepID=A0ABQ7PVA9_PLUXY|nr:hypothetical protein JYU34_019775 [Plutella xylostella]
MTSLLKTPPARSLLSKKNTLSTYSEPDISQLQMDENDVTLNVTQRAKRQRTQDSVSDEISSFKAELLSLMNNFISTQSNRLDKLEDHIKTIKDQNKIIQSTNEDIEKSMNHLSEDIRTLETKITGLEQERKSINSYILGLENKIHNMEINALKTCIEIRNVPKVAKETKSDLYGYTLKLGNFLKVHLQQSDVRDVSRLPSKKEQDSSSISIELNNTFVKTQLLDAMKKYKKENYSEQINSNDLGIKTKKPIYVSELLTPKMKRLLFLCREFAKTEGYSFVWPLNGRIFMRQKEGSPHILVKSEEQLGQMKRQATEK